MFEDQNMVGFMANSVVEKGSGPRVRGAAGPRVYLYTPVQGPGSK